MIVRCLIFFLLCTGLSQAKEKRASIVVDDKTGKILYQEWPNERRHPASLTKMMTLYIIFEDLKKGKIRPTTKVRVSRKASSQIASKLYLKPNELISVRQIIPALIIKSANDAAYAAAEGLAGSMGKFTKRMNATAKKLGMKRTRFYNSSGVPDKRQVTTAKDMYILAKALYDHFPKYYHHFKRKHFFHNKKLYRTYNNMVKKVHGVDGLKTGYINDSGFNIAVSAQRKTPQDKKHRLYVVVMGGKSVKARDKKAKRLLNLGYRRVRNMGRFKKAPVINTVVKTPVQANQNLEDILKKAQQTEQVCRSEKKDSVLDLDTLLRKKIPHQNVVVHFKKAPDLKDVL